MKRQRWAVAAVFFLFGVLIFCDRLVAAPYYEGKKISIVVGSEPGGGYDRTARLIAKYLSKYIPGKPAVIVENMPGASGMIAANQVYNMSKPDGLTIGMSNQALVFPQLLKGDGVRFDLTKFAWIGSVAAEASILMFRTDLPYRSFEDLRKAKEPISLSTSGVANQNYQFPILLKEFTGVNFKMVFYPSTSAGMLAVERKETDGMSAFLSSGRPYINRGLVKPLVRGRISEPEIAGLPVDEDLTPNKLGKTIMAIRSAPEQITRAFAAPPGTPADIMAILKDSLAKTTKDPELLEDARKLMMKLEYVSGEECIKSLNYVLNQPEDVVKELSKYIKF